MADELALTNSLLCNTGALSCKRRTPAASFPHRFFFKIKQQPLIVQWHWYSIELGTKCLREW